MPENPHALRSLIHNYFDSQRNKIISEKGKLHDLLTDEMLFAVKRGIISLPEKQCGTTFAVKRGDHFYARRAKHTLYGVWYTTISMVKEIKQLRKKKNYMIF